MPNNALWIMFIAAFTTNAFATSPDLSGISVGELGQVQSETILLKAKADRAKAERDATHVDSTVQSPPAGMGFVGAPAQYAPPQNPTSNTQNLPVIRAITGSTRKLTATLLYSGGVEIDVATGRDLPDGFRVAQISLDGVTLVRKGQLYPLGFSNQAPVPAAIQQAPAMPQPAALPGTYPTHP